MAISLTQPVVGGNADAWGGLLNTNIAKLQDTLNGSDTANKATISPDFSSFKINNTNVIVSAAELNKLSGATVTTAEINIVDGSTSATATTLVDADRVVVNDDGTMVQVAMTDVATYINTDADLNGTTKIEEIVEKVTLQTTTSETINFDCKTQAIEFYTADQTADRTINFRGDSSTTLDTMLAVGESITVSIAMTQGSTAYYLSTYQIDGSAVTPKWQGGSAPDSGNASGVDVYTFVIIKTGSATFTVLASLTDFA
jgi:hypothetical protein